MCSVHFIAILACFFFYIVVLPFAPTQSAEAAQGLPTSNTFESEAIHCNTLNIGNERMTNEIIHHCGYVTLATRSPPTATDSQSATRALGLSLGENFHFRAVTQVRSIKNFLDRFDRLDGLGFNERQRG